MNHSSFFLTFYLKNQLQSQMDHAVIKYHVFNRSLVVEISEVVAIVFCGRQVIIAPYSTYSTDTSRNDRSFCDNLLFWPKCEFHLDFCLKNFKMFQDGFLAICYFTVLASEFIIRTKGA